MKRVRCCICGKPAKLWAFPWIDPICLGDDCKARLFKRKVEVKVITKEEHDIYGDD